MNPTELLRAGKLGEAIQTLGAELRNYPTDAKRRTFLFELLCFAGDYDRAEKHLHLLAETGPGAEMGVLVYRAILAAERARQETFLKREYAAQPAEPVPFSGTLNGKPFQSLADADPRIGAHLETYAAGSYLWIPFAHIASIECGPPRRLRDLLWIPAMVRTGPGFKGTELGEILIPALSPLTWQSQDDAVRLGRATVWEESEDGEEIPSGQKMLLVDGEEIPIMELRSLRIESTAGAAAGDGAQ